MSTALVIDLHAQAAAINQQHALAEANYRTALEHALACGRLLTEAKDAVGHGGWLPWLEDNFVGSTRIAQRYMQLAGAPQLSNASEQAHFGTIDEALKTVSKPRKMSSSEMGDVFATAGVPTQRHAPAPAPTIDPARDRRDQRAALLLTEARDAQQQAHLPGLQPVAVARAYRDAAIKAQRAAAILDELAIAYER